MKRAFRGIAAAMACCLALGGCFVLGGCADKEGEGRAENYGSAGRLSSGKADAAKEQEAESGTGSAGSRTETGSGTRSAGSRTETGSGAGSAGLQPGTGSGAGNVGSQPGTAEPALMPAQAVNRFAYQLAQELSENGENYFFSPYSICSALAVLDNAAGGETKEQMERMLGITDLAFYNREMARFREQPQDEEARLTGANSLWIRKGYELTEAAYTDYLPFVERAYGAEIWEADFYGDPDGTRDAVNRWVEEQTNGMIPEFRKENYDADTVLSIINAVYFYGEWSVPFDAYATYEQVFHGKNADASVSMMHNGEISLPYYEAGALRGLCMPYGDGSKVMNILLPAEGEERTAAELFAALSEEEKDSFLTTLTQSERTLIYSLALPKLELAYSVPDMAEVLRGLGMTDAFDFARADFRGLADPAETDFFVTEVNHMAKLEVDELGSRASAVTEIAAEDGCAIMDDEKIIEFIVDQPFLLFIQDRDTGMILFMGEINDLE